MEEDVIEIRVGDLVRLKSGGTPMVVGAINNTRLTCIKELENGYIHTVRLDPRCVTLIS